MKRTMIALDKSWLNGIFSNGEINTRLPYFAVNEPEFFAQGESADNIINEIYEYWINNDCTPEQAFNNWINLYL